MFLHSRVGLRVLLLFIVAAGAPMLLLTTLSQHTIADLLSRSESALLAASAKSSGMQTIERLRVARQALSAAGAQADMTQRPERRPPLLAAVEVQPGGARTVLHGAANAAPLLDLPVDASAAPSLVLVASGPESAPVPVIRLPADGRSGARLGLVNPAFLWDGTGELPVGLWLCAVDAQARALFCSATQQARTAARWAREVTPERTSQRTPEPTPERRDDARHAVWTLFLGADLAADDWYFVVGSDPAAHDPAGDATTRTLFIAATAGLLLAILLSLVQIRRTLKPLVRLTTAARALARREAHTPLEQHGKDEFGELATAFNGMAAQMQSQFSELEALAAIDRQIASRSDLEGIHAAIADRLAEVLRGRNLLLAHVATDAPGRAVCHLRGPATVTIGPHLRDIDANELTRLYAASKAGEWVDCEAGAELPSLTIPVAGGDAARAAVLTLRWREQCFGCIVVGGIDSGELDAHTLRQVFDLRHRAAMAASAAEREQSLQRDARYDGLTGLLNRQGLKEHLLRCIADAGVGARTLALLFIDLDRFKSVNDSLGHAAGDQALRLVAARVQRCLPANGFAARQAGDEFIVVLPGTDHDTAAAAARELGDSLAQVLVVDEAAFALSASIGVTLCSDIDAVPAQLLRSADQAMYEAKRQGGRRFVMFDRRLDAAAERRSWIERELPQAGERGQLQLLYQPRVDRRSGRMESVEALIRWNHPQHGLCMPAEFIPVAESSELIEHVGRWVIDTAFAQARLWNEGRPELLRVAINLSPRQLNSAHLVRDLCAALARHHVLPASIELEITEGLFLEQTQATLDRLIELRKLGITLALDDFGTGYSSLSYLRSLPIDIIKIDRAFVKDLGTDASALAVARAIVALATSLHMRTVAEGVENEQQLLALQSLRCDEMQGFLFSRPVAPEAITQMLVDRDTLLSESGMAPLATRQRG